MSSPLVSWICFVFCLGLTAGGVLVLFRRKEYGQHLPMRYLRYYLILIYTFGFYALWSRLLLRELYFPIIPPGSRVLLARFLTLISVPFLLAGKAMLVMWAIHVLRPARRQLIASGLIVVSGAVLLGLWGRELLWTVNQIYAAFVLVLMLAMGTLLILGESKYLDRKPQLLLAGLVVGIGAIHLPMLAGTTPASPFEVIFIFLYFLSHTSFATVFVYQAKLPEAEPSPLAVLLSTKVTSLETFIESYGITPREAEIIREIYQGKTNKEIAEQLFVTVQTIKDHTHRIYQKTDVKSRTKLVSLMRKFLA